MIHIVELPAEQAAHAWFAFNGEDLRVKVAAALDCEPHTVWDCTNARELLEMMDATPDQPGAREQFPALFALGEGLGWDTPLYRADALLGDGMLQVDNVDLLQACEDALRERSDLRFYADDSAAMAAFERGDGEFAQHGWRARWALREQLVELEVLADDN